MAQGSPAYARLHEDSDEELASPVASEEVKPPEPPPASQTPVVGETEEKAPEGAPSVQPGYQPAVLTAMPPGYQPVPIPGYEPADIPLGVPPSYQPVGIPPAGSTPAEATALNTTTEMQTQPTGGMAVLYSQRKPEDYLALSVFSMLCCCFIFGLMGLIYSLQVNSSWNVGDYEGARSASKAAKHWSIAAIVTGGVFAAFGGIFVLVAVIVTVTTNTNRYG